MLNLCVLPKKIKRAKAPVGSKDKIVYKYVYDEKYGCPRRVENGKISVDDLIQSYADDVDFKSIGQMLVDTRDNVKGHFTDVNGEIVDVTGQPRNIHEYEALHNKMKSNFEALPDDLKILFGNDFNTFRTSYIDGSINQVFETYSKSKETPTEKPTEGGND